MLLSGVETYSGAQERISRKGGGGGDGRRKLMRMGTRGLAPKIENSPRKQLGCFVLIKDVRDIGSPLT